VQTSAGAAIEGATITLKAENGATYSGTTNAEGAYSFNVIQAGLDFTATVEAEGYLKRQFALNMGGASKTLDTALYQQIGIVGDAGMGLSWDEDLVMTQSEEDANIFTLTVEKAVTLEEQPEAGWGYKLRADGAWGLSNKYELPNDGNNHFKFEHAGTYTMTFTGDMTNHTLTLDAIAQINTVQIMGSDDRSWSEESKFTFNLTKNAEGIYEGTIDLSEAITDAEFKLVINSETNNNWIGANMLTLVDEDGLITAKGGDGSDFVLHNSTSGYKTYAVTAAWVANANEAEGWTLTITPEVERDAIFAVVGGIKDTNEAGIFSGRWNTANTTDIMTTQEGKYVWAANKQALTEGTVIELKVIKKYENDTKVLEWYPEGDNVEITINKTAKYNITVTFADGVVTAEAVEDSDPTGINNFDTTNTLDGDIYNVGGVRSEKLQKGQMNIVRTKDGKVRKVYVK